MDARVSIYRYVMCIRTISSRRSWYRELPTFICDCLSIATSACVYVCAREGLGFGGGWRRGGERGRERGEGGGGSGVREEVHACTRMRVRSEASAEKISLTAACACA